jgi:hypothetical protein
MQDINWTFTNMIVDVTHRRLDESIEKRNAGKIGTNFFNIS